MSIIHTHLLVSKTFLKHIVNKSVRFGIRKLKIYQLDFLIPLMWPDFTNFKKTVREKLVNLWNVFLLIVFTHRFERIVFDLLFVKEESLDNAFHCVVLEKFEFADICFNIKFFNSNFLTICLFF